MKKKLYLVLVICCLSMFAMMACDNGKTGTDINNKKDVNVIDDARDAVDDAGDSIDNAIDDPKNTTGDIIDNKDDDLINDATHDNNTDNNRTE
jgi:hypothetical protein